MKIIKVVKCVIIIGAGFALGVSPISESRIINFFVMITGG